MTRDRSWGLDGTRPLSTIDTADCGPTFDTTKPLLAHVVGESTRNGPGNGHISQRGEEWLLSESGGGQTRLSPSICRRMALVDAFVKGLMDGIRISGLAVVSGHPPSPNVSMNTDCWAHGKADDIHYMRRPRHEAGRHSSWSSLDGSSNIVQFLTRHLPTAPRRTRSAVVATGVRSTSKRRVSCSTSHTVPNSTRPRWLTFLSTACASCGYPSAKIRSYEWGQKAKRRKTTGTGRMRYLKTVPRKAKNGFRTGAAVAASA